MDVELVFFVGLCFGLMCGAIGPFGLWYDTNHKPGINLVRMCDFCGTQARGFIRDDLNKYGVDV